MGNKVKSCPPVGEFLALAESLEKNPPVGGAKKKRDEQAKGLVLFFIIFLKI